MSYIIADNIISPLGFNTSENFSRLLKAESGVQRHENELLLPEPLWASLFSTDQKKEITSQYDDDSKYTTLEQILISSVSQSYSSVQNKIDISGVDTLFIFSTTKGNIDILDKDPLDIHNPGLSLFNTARKVSQFFKNPNRPLVVSSACISGTLAIVTAQRFLKSGQYKNAVVFGGDLVSKFVASGFHSFLSLDSGVCKPFDEKRQGLNLGEGGACVIISTERLNDDDVAVAGGGSSNDANHISGPSRTGDGLYKCIADACNEASIAPSDASYVSAHGTATPYNDEMEAKAFHLAGLGQVPVNSLKAYFGHTLGAAGLIESVISIESLRKGQLIVSRGYQTHGVSVPLNIIRNTVAGNFSHAIKTSSGFGGCNAAVVFSKQY